MRLRPYRGVLGFICLMGFLLLWPALPIQAQGSAPAKGKPAFYDFGAKYCVPCKEMQEVVAELKPQYGDQVEFRLIYSDEEMLLFKQYKIVAIPTQVFLNAEGKEVDRHLGALSKEEVLRKLREMKFIH
jgi:thioredoxin